MIKDTLPSDLAIVVTGGLSFSKRFAQLRFDHLLYTGSSAIGKTVMGEATNNLLPITLELGGKRPAVMTRGSVNDENVESILGIKMVESGQMCLSIDYFLCPKEDVHAFTKAAVKLLADKLSNFTISKDNTGMVSERHLERINGLVKQAEDASVKSLQIGGEAGQENAKRQLLLTLLIDPSRDLAVMQEEIFGPILPIVPYDDLDAAVKQINHAERPLGLYVYSDNLEDANPDRRQDRIRRCRDQHRRLTGRLTLSRVWWVWK